jgi:hypothetical protein
MVVTTLNEIRTHIETLASDDGAYLVRCGRTGEKPVPVSGLRFDSRTGARSAARATGQYRAALRRYDPQVPYYDLIVCENTDFLVSATDAEAHPAPASREPPAESCSTPVDTGSEPVQRRLVEFCHSTAAAVFEALSNGGYDDTESAVMDAYFEHAETVADPDTLCLRLLESMALELGSRLHPEEQAAVLESAATRKSPPEATDRPVAATMSALEDSGLVAGYAQSPWSVAVQDGTKSVVTQLSAYALSPKDGRLPVLPIALELYRHQHEWQPLTLRVGDVDDGWQLTLTMATDTTPSGLASARIES